MKRIVVLGLAALVLVGCSSNSKPTVVVDGNQGNRDIATFTVKTNTGRSVECITVNGVNGGSSISCDWSAK